MKYLKVIVFLIISISGALVSCHNQQQTTTKEGFKHFIKVDGNKLMDGDKVFRFVSFNVPTLHYNEDEFEFSQLHAYSLPDEFELRDVFETISQIGGKVIRMYTIPVKMEFEPDGTPTYVTGPNQFSEEAFETLDLALALANEYQVRIIFSLLNNWQWMGGRPQYARFRDKSTDEFWTDPQLIDDFKATINYTLNRTNTITEVPYRNDKSILCWETGNELTSPIEWTIDICRYIKSLDTNHLVMDGYHAIDNNPVREASIAEASIDLIHSHHYETNPIQFAQNVNRNLSIIAGRKPYIIGEFGFVGTTAIEQYINTVIDSEVCGMLLWGLRGHRSSGGYYWHSEPLGFGRFKAYHWPGFDSGQEWDETDLMALMHNKAFEIDGKQYTPAPVPKAPELLPIEHTGRISWRGSAGASAYDLYRSESHNGPYQLIGYNLSDANVQYYPLYNDNSVEIGKSYYYKLIAKNKQGSSEYSNIVGPVKVESQALIDNMNNYGKMYYSTPGIVLKSTDDRKFKEDMYRMEGTQGDELIYYVTGTIAELKIYSFSRENSDNLSVEISADGYNYQEVTCERTSYNNGKGDYDYWIPIAYSYQQKTMAQFLKIHFNQDTQLSRVEIYYR